MRRLEFFLGCSYLL
jgi:hypothetical protein